MNSKAPVIFDFGGVVFRWRPIELVREVMPHRAADDAGARDLALLVFQGHDLEGDWSDFDRGLVSPQGLVSRIARRTGLPPAEIETLLEAVPSHLEAQPPTVALMRRLKDAGHPLFYLSNMPAPFADHLERHHDFFAWFHDGLFSGRVHRLKPERAFFEQAHERFGLEGRHAVFIDDSMVNVEAARVFGWRAVRFEDAAQCEAELAAFSVTGA